MADPLDFTDLDFDAIYARIVADVLLPLAVLALGAALLWYARGYDRVQEARRADAERYATALSALHTSHATAIAAVQAERIEEIERIVRGCDTLAEALRALQELRDSHAPRPGGPVSPSVAPPVADRYAAARERRTLALAGLSAQIAATLAPAAPRVLLVEDDPDVGELLAESLRSAFAGCGRPLYLRLVADAVDACEAARRESWAAAVVDLPLGHARLSGLDVVAALSSWTPVVLVSGTVPEALPALAGRVRASAHFEKPVDLARLAACVGDLLLAGATAH